jgi:beta-glucosidase-like glycosyl hydrolase
MAEAALDAGVGGFVIAAEHVQDEGTIRYLRKDAGYDGIIAAPIAEAAERFDADEAELAVRCVAAGCDLLLGSDEPQAVIRALRTAVSHGVVSAELVRVSSSRIESAAAWAAAEPGGREPTLDDTLWARRVADAAIHVQRGGIAPLRGVADVIVVDDDPPRPEPVGSAVAGTLAQLGVDVRQVAAPTTDARFPVVILLVGDRRLSLGFDTFSEGSLRRVRELCVQAERNARDVVVVHFTPPEFMRALDGCPHVVCAWSGTRAMEEAAARWLVRGQP